MMVASTMVPPSIMWPVAIIIEVVCNIEVKGLTGELHPQIPP